MEGEGVEAEWRTTDEIELEPFTSHQPTDNSQQEPARRHSSRSLQFQPSHTKVCKRHQPAVLETASTSMQQFQMNRYILQSLEFYRRKEKLLGLDFNQFSNFFYLHQLDLSIYC